MIPVVIVGHHRRSGAVDRLAEKVFAEAVVMDNGRIGPGANHERAWRWLVESDDTWGVCLEDDAIPIKGFREELGRVLAVAPSPVVSLYLGRGRPSHWRDSISSVIVREESWLLADELLHHVAVAMRTEVIPDMLAWLAQCEDYQHKRMPIDEAIGAWARANTLMVAYAHPSIVDHDHTAPTVITRHVSSCDGETGRRSPDDPAQRRAWVLGSRHRDSSTWEIPTPRGLRDRVWR